MEVMIMLARTLSMKLALRALSQKDARLTLMHTRWGLQYFVIPGGPVDDDVAKSIIDRADVMRFDDGLFPGHAQSYRMIR
jgi:hypothetical protein